MTALWSGCITPCGADLEQAAREASSTAAIIYAQSVKSAGKGRKDLPIRTGYDAGKRRSRARSGMCWSIREGLLPYAHPFSARRYPGS